MTREEFLKEYERQPVYFHTENLKEAEAFIEKLREWDLRWGSGRSFLPNHVQYITVSHDTPYAITPGENAEDGLFKRADVAWYRRRGYTHVPISEILTPKITTSLYG